MRRIIWWFNGLKWKLREKIVCLGITDATAYYVSALYGDDENGGLNKVEAFLTYDRAQGALDYSKHDIVVLLDVDATTFETTYA